MIVSFLLLVNGNSKNSTQNQISELYHDEQIKIINSEMVDLYLIASALYYNFDSDYFISGVNALEENTISYFLPYKDHPFIQNMGNYVDNINQCYDFNILGPLITYCMWQGYNPPEEVLQSNAFESKADFEIFWQGLNQFYEDVNAATFFNEQKNYIDQYQNEVETFASSHEIQAYINEMERYIGNKELWEQNQNIQYAVLTSFFKIDGASFIKTYGQQSIIYLCFTGILEDHRDIQSMNMDRIMENMIHEYLHCYINPYVESKMEMIDNLYMNEKKSDYTSGGYLNMSWNRIIDENIVRAMSTRIIGHVIGDEEKAYNQIMRREIEFGGFARVNNIYNILPIYEEHREKYTEIGEYIEPMIETLLEK